MHVLKMRDLRLTDGVLYGSVLGRKAADKLLKMLPPSAHNQVVVVDFVGIRQASASFLREALLGLKAGLQRRSHVVIVGNANETIRDELGEMLAAHGEVMLLCELDTKGVSHAQVVGPLDPGQKKVLDAATARTEITAQDLSTLFPDEGIGITAWNNRLAALSTRGLLTEGRRGRQKFYSALSRSISHGC